jgi:Tol biopolymer transport system component
MIAVVSIIDNNLIVKSYLTIDDEKAAILDPAWSPNGNFLSFYISRPFDARDSSAHGPYLVNIECYKNSVECKIEPSLLGVEGISHWTPDGFLAVVDKTQIFLFDPITKQVEKTLTVPMKDTRIESFAWSPDNQWIAFAAPGYDGAPGTNAVYVMRLWETNQPILLDGKDGGEVLFWLSISK